MKHKKTVANIFQWMQLVMWLENWHEFFRLFMGYLSLKHKYKNWSTLFGLYWEMKGLWSRVNLWQALLTSQDSHVTRVLSFPNANKKCANVFKTLSDYRLWYSPFSVLTNYAKNFSPTMLCICVILTMYRRKCSRCWDRFGTSWEFSRTRKTTCRSHSE